MKNKILPILLLFLGLSAWAQPCKFYPAKNNLSSSRINGIFCDRWGNLWIPTEFGLNRYDGCDFVVFTNDPSDPASLASNYVSSVSEDSAGHLFVCSHGGIQLFDEGSRSFSTTAKDTDGTPYNKQVLCIIERANGDLLAIGTEVVKLEIRDGSLRVMDTDFTLPAGYVRDICEDSWGSLWFKIDGHGVVRLKPDGSIKEFFSSPEHHVTDIFENPAGHELLVADTNEGLFVFDQIADVFNHVPYGGGLLPASLLYSYGNRLLVGTEGKGLKSWDGDEITSFSLKGENSFEDGRVRGFTTDQGGNLWLAFYQEGLVLVPSKSGNFNYIGHNSTEEDKIGSGSISAICRTRDGIMWIATMSGELYGFDGGGRKVASFKSDGSPTSIPNPVFSLFEDSRGNVWTGSFSSGVSILNTRSGRCSRILPGGGQVLSGNVVDFTEDESGCIWIATEGSGLLRYDPGRGELRNMSEELPDFPRHITSIKAARHGRLMVGTYRGSLYLDLNDSFRIVRISSDDIAHDIIEASDERIWFGCDDGVTVWNPNTGRIIKYGEAEGLSGDVVYSILEDRGGGIWMGTNNGLSYYNIARNRFFNYMEEDGVQGKEFCSGATWEDADGTLWFGGVDGVTWFDPRKISSPVRKWNLKITDVYMHGQPIKTTTISGNKPAIDVPISEATEIRLKYSDNAFTLRFCPVDYDFPARLEYYYSLNNGPWISAQGSTRQSFSSLAPGRYNVRLKTVDSGLESEPVGITFNIRPAWWASAFARIAFALLALGAIAAAWMLIRRTRSAHRRMQQIAEEEKIKESKMEIFTKMAHELRSPLSLIINPLHRLMGNDTDPAHQKSYRTMERNSQRILMLVNQLLEMQKIEGAKLELSFSKVDLIPYIGRIVDNFKDEFALREIGLNYNHSGLRSLYVGIDPNQFDKVIFNLLSNSLKFTPNEGEVTVDVARLDGVAEITVTDNGIGIYPEERDKIFGQFYQAENSRATWDSGTGIGLHLSKMLVEMHHGTIAVVDNDGAPHGSRFIVRIPLYDASVAALPVADEQPAEILPENEAEMVPEAAEPAPKKEKVIARSKKVIFVVDDDPEVGEYLSEEFSRDYHMKHFPNGKLALEAALKNCPDLIISDIMMPVMDGITLCRKVRQNINLNHVPLILLTAKTGVEDNIEGLNTGADAYIPKPFDVGVLRSTVDNLLGSRQMLRNKFEGRQSREKDLTEIDIKTPDDKLMTRIMRIMNENLSSPELTVDFLSHEVGISRSHIYRKLRELTNQSPQDFIRNTRLAMAAKLLKEGNQSISEVAEKVGFANPDNFATAFKRLYGKTPREYMKSGD